MSADPTWLPHTDQRRIVSVSLPPSLHDRLAKARAQGHDINLSKIVQRALIHRLRQLGV